MQKLRIEGASLEPREIFDLFSLLDRGADAKSVLTAAAGRFPRLGLRGQSIGDFRGLLQDLEGKILPDGTVADHASVALARLRRDMERQKKAIQESLERFLKAHREEGILQEEFVTIRNERFVVPVIAGQRRKLDGVIHGASSSGHTLFVEPLETIDLNNELVRLGEEEAREVHRILLEMTDRLRGHADSIRQTLAIMAELDLIFAKARVRHRSSIAPSRALASGCCCARRAIRCSKTCCGAASASRVPVSLELELRAAHAADQRPQHWRQNGDAEDRGTAQPDGASRAAGAGGGSRIPALRAGTGRYRRLPVDPGEPQHVFGARLATSAKWRWM